MIPLYDTLHSRHFPIVNLLIIIANVLVFIYQSILPDPEQVSFLYSYATIPAVLLGQATPTEQAEGGDTCSQRQQAKHPNDLQGVEAEVVADATPAGWWDRLARLARTVRDDAR